MIPSPLTDVPAAKVGQVVQDFIDLDHVQDLSVVEQANGEFTVTPLR